MFDKKSLRKKLKITRANVKNKVAKDENIKTQLLGFLAKNFTNAKTIFIYQSFGTEVATTEIIEELGKLGLKILIPKTDENFNMQAVCIKTSNVFADTPSITIVPLLGFNKGNHRIGYGKACYDKFFAFYPNSIKIGLAYKEQLCDFLSDTHDIPLDYIITDTV